MLAQLLQNKYIQSVLVFLAVIGLHSLYVQLTFQESAVEDETGEVMAMPMDMMVSESVSVEETVVENNDKEIDYTGTHIMPNGDIMTGSGLILPEAIITEDGLIQLSNGDVLTPAVDMRQ